jgi:CheY-like chemotaxis protein
LPDRLGTSLLTQLRDALPDCRFVLISGFLSTAITVEAMKQGAVDVLEKPVRMDDLLAVVWSIIGARPRRRGGRSTVVANGSAADAGTMPVEATVFEGVNVSAPGSAAERWAGYVLKGCRAQSDLKTLTLWAACAGVSYTSLRENCRLVGIRPHDARDLTRLLRAVITSSSRRCSPQELLDVSDTRTLNTLLTRAGLAALPQALPPSPRQFLQLQQFVRPDNAGLRILQTRFAAAAIPV